jgi:4-alpha-glucanotransferase
VDDAVRELAREAGIANDWVDAADHPQRVKIDALRSILEALGLPCATAADIAESRARLRASHDDERPLVTATTDMPIRLTGVRLDQDAAGEVLFEHGSAAPIRLRAARGTAAVAPIGKPGYHRIRFADCEIMLAVAPPRCVTLNDVAPGEKLFGLAIQLYALRRHGDGGMGDMAALRDLVDSAARAGADAIALSPVHSLFAADPSHYGPYSPSSRLFLNPLFADPAMLFGEARVAASLANVGTPRQSQHEHDALIDWPNVGAAKLALLRRLFDDFAENDLAAGRHSALAADFHAFVRDGGARLHEHALFEAAHQHWYRSNEPLWSWSDWPLEWRSPRGLDITRFANAEARAIQFHVFLQWMATRSLSAVQRGARTAGMRVGLIADLAIGMSPGGSHAWSRQQDLLLGLTIGAPPDPFNLRGQDWGLTAFSPQALMASGFEPFIATMRAAMRDAGGVRIDHVMGLARLWLIPRGHPPTEGAYLRYPIDDLLRIAALESYRHRAIVIGEDLGTVPPEFRGRAARAGIAGMDVLWFQRNKSGFLAPKKWRRDAVAMTTTHDLPTVAGWWQGADIATRNTLGLVADVASETRQRAKDRAALWRAFCAARVAAGAPPDNAPVDAAIAFTAQSPAPLALIPIEDVLGLSEQPNLPGTINEHPNWRRRLNEPASELLNAAQAQSRLKILRERRT